MTDESTVMLATSVCLPDTPIEPIYEDYPPNAPQIRNHLPLPAEMARECLCADSWANLIARTVDGDDHALFNRYSRRNKLRMSTRHCLRGSSGHAIHWSFACLELDADGQRIPRLSLAFHKLPALCIS
ncbi:unnamed protein product [Clonostachys rosea]|uniref:Uncharacterized protein n=1 Tax=Bionectria ochroleuca TaxID=29856 RepID=A0ABY6V073_BIOOC|nr:unnamed protein product [Clonostachys rosea]